MSFLRSTVDYLRDRYAPVTHTSTFRSTGQLTPEEFLAAGDFLTYRFPSWSWAPASHPSRRVSYLPPDKQFLVTRGVPCHCRLGDAIAGAETNETLIKDFLAGPDGDEAGEDGGWLSTGGDTGNVGDVRTLDQSGRVEDKDESADEDIPDMEDEEDDDEAIIRDKGTKSATRTYNIYITYTPYYRTPRLYLSGYASTSEPLPPRAMMDDIVGDYADKTVTLEDFPFFDAASSVKMASIHPCKHASVMKVLLDRADAALKLRREKLRAGKEASTAGMEGLIDDTSKLSVGDHGHHAGVAAAGGNGGDEWEVLEGENEEESALRVDQYLVVFIKFVGSVTPTIEHDFTMGV